LIIIISVIILEAGASHQTSVIQLKSIQWRMKRASMYLIQMSRGSVTNTQSYVDWLSAVFRANWQCRHCVIRCRHICLAWTQTHRHFMIKMLQH